MKPLPVLPLFLLFWSVHDAMAGGTSGKAEGILPTAIDVAHLHLLTNHAPLFFTLSGLVVLALFWKREEARRAALLLLLLGMLGGLVTYWLGGQAYKPVRGLADETGQDWLDTHLERAEKTVWIYWVAGATALAGLACPRNRPRCATWITLAAGGLGVVALVASGWVADAGGKIRHSEIRVGTRPSPQRWHWGAEGARYVCSGMGPATAPRSGMH